MEIWQGGADMIDFYSESGSTPNHKVRNHLDWDFLFYQTTRVVFDSALASYKC